MRQANDVVARRVDDATVLIHLQTNKIYELNSTGSRIWELVGEGRDAAAIRKQLVQEFEVDEAEVARAVEETLTRLMDEGLVRREEA